MDELACIRGTYGFVCGVGLDERAYQQLLKCAHKHSDDAKLEARLRRRLVVIARCRARGAPLRALKLSVKPA